MSWYIENSFGPNLISENADEFCEVLYDEDIILFWYFQFK